jgi:hypothetical protein
MRSRSPSSAGLRHYHLSLRCPTYSGFPKKLPLGMQRMVSGIVLGAGALNLGTLFVLASWFGAPGAAMAALVTEITVTIVMAGVLHNRGIPIFKLPHML